MNTKQFNKAVAIVKKDATLQSEYLSEDGEKMCVIGGLAIHSGFPEKDLKMINTKGILGNESKTKKLRAHLNKKFGLNAGELSDLQCANDTTSPTRKRRSRLIEMLRSFVEE